jgi:hypothetical protein
MGSSPSPPPQMDYGRITAQQTAANEDAYQQQLTSGAHTGQDTPFGTLQYVQTGVDDKGNPQYTAVSKLSPQEQALLTQLQGTQQAAGQMGQGLLKSVDYSKAPDFASMSSGLTKDMIDKQLAYLQPDMDRQIAQLDTKMRNQGLTPGTEAYDNEIRNLRNQQEMQKANIAAQGFTTAFNAARQQYMTPMEIASQLTQMGSPANLTGSFTQTPQPNLQPANVIGAAQAAAQNNMGVYNAQMGQYNSMLGGGVNLMTGLFGMM